MFEIIEQPSYLFIEQPSYFTTFIEQPSYFIELGWLNFQVTMLRLPLIDGRENHTNPSPPKVEA